jgi:hypothetical protein
VRKARHLVEFVLGRALDARPATLYKRGQFGGMPVLIGFVLLYHSSFFSFVFL